MAQPTTFVVKHVDLVPFEGSMPRFSAGLFKDGAVIRQSLLTRTEGGRVWGSRVPAYRRPVREIAGEYFFGGYLFPHYGHFLLESLSRLRGLLRYNGLPAIFFSRNEYFARWQNDILGILGVTSRIILAHKPVRFECVVFTEPDCVLHERIAPELVAALGCYARREPDTAADIWVSRGKCDGGGLVNEAAIESVLSARGWEIYHPQDHPVREQIERLGGARNVAGLDGSAFYTLLLAKHVAGNVSIVSRRGFVPAVMRQAFAAAGIRHRFFIPEIRHVAGKEAGARFEAAEVAAIVRDVLAAAT